MSNKIVPGIYRAVIDEVMAAIKPEFEEYGVSEDVLAELHSKWQHKVIASHVADFETPHAAPHLPQHHPYPAHPMHMIQGPYGAPPHPYVQPPPAPPGPGGVKTEPVDTRYMLSSQPIQYALPPLPGPQINGARQTQPPQYGGQTSVLSFPPGPPPVQALPTNGAGVPLGRPYVPPTAAASSSPSPAPASSSAPAPASAASTTSSSGGGGSGGRIPQLDGPASDDSDEDDGTPPPLPYVPPRSTHPSLPQPQSQASTSSAVADSEAINSDLDDSDTGDEEEAEEGAAGETDIVFCTYDKVARVKNKWKCILKDGMIHVNGKDYLFSKCTGEFEW